MVEDDYTTLWSRHMSRRSVLNVGGLGVAATAFGGIGALATPSDADAAKTQHSSIRPGMSSEEMSNADRVARAIDGLEDIVSDIMERSGVPGIAISVTHKDAVAYVQGFGVRDSRGSDPVNEDTVFQLASLSKPFASTVVAGLVGDGTAEWDSRVTELLPEFEMFDPWVSREVTIRDMLSHRSGLPDHAADLLEDIGYNRDEILHRLRFQAPAYSLRSGYAYTNFGYTAGAVAAARATGMTWEEASQKRLYDRLGLTRTTSSFAVFMSESNRARGHAQVDGEWRSVHVRNPDPQSPAGGVSSCARDMARWMQLHLGNGTFDGEEIISPKALAEPHRPHVVSAQPADPLTDRAGFYGLGWNVSYDDAGRVRLGHSGAFLLGASTAVSIVPALDIGISVLTNAAPVGVPESIIASFVDLIDTGEVQRDYLEIIGPAMEQALASPYETDHGDPPANASEPLDNSAYSGTYENALYGPIEISSSGDGLRLALGPDGLDHELTHFDRDVFTYEPVGENAYGPTLVTFTIQPDGSAGRVVIDMLNESGQGEFTKA